VAAVQSSGRSAVVALPRILKPDESRLLFFYLRLGADALLLRGAGALQQLMELGGEGAVVDAAAGRAVGGGGDGGSTTDTDGSTASKNDATSSSSSSSSGSTTSSSSSSGATSGATSPSSSNKKAVRIPRLEGDFSLNTANALTAHLLLSSGLSRLTPTHDLDASQLAELALALGAPRARRLEAIVHTHMPIFHTEHCVFARFLSCGNSFLDCGHPCEVHSVHLRDHQGEDHLVLADMGCRNTVRVLGCFLEGGGGCLMACAALLLLDQPCMWQLSYRRAAQAQPKSNPSFSNTPTQPRLINTTQNPRSSTQPPSPARTTCPASPLPATAPSALSWSMSHPPTSPRS